MTTVRLARVAQTISGSGFPLDAQGKAEGELPFLKVSDLAREENEAQVVGAANWVSRYTARELGARVVPTGATVFPKVGAALLGNARGQTSRPCVIDNNMMAVVPVGVEARFMYWLMRGVDIGPLSAGGALPFVTDSAIRNLRVYLPNPAQQRRIADFLDYRVCRIDRIIAARRKQLVLLIELRAAQLRLHVAGGFEDSPTRSTNIGWLSRMHQGAEAVRLSRVVTLQRGVDLTEDERRPGVSKVVTTAGVVGTHDESVSLGPGVVIGRYGSVGNVHWVEGPHWPHNTTLYVRSTHGNNLRWIYYLLSVFPYEVLQARAAVPGVNRNEMASEMVPLLPLSLQTVAVGYLDAAADDFDNRTRSLERSIGLLAEYKTSLITAAVTGEFDVTTAGSNIPG